MLTSAMGILAEAASDTPGFDVLPLIERFGLPLVFLVLVMFGYLVPKWTYTAMKEDRDAERAARIALQDALLKDIGPALTRSTDAVTRSLDLSERLLRRREGGE